MSKVAIVTDSNSGITQSEAKEYGVTVKIGRASCRERV